MGWCGRTPQEGSKNDSCTCILDHLQWTDGVQRQTCQERVAVVQSWNDQGLNKYLSDLCGNKCMNPSDLVKERSRKSTSDRPWLRQGFMQWLKVKSKSCPGWARDVLVMRHLGWIAVEFGWGLRLSWWSARHAEIWVQTWVSVGGKDVIHIAVIWNPSSRDLV